MATTRIIIRGISSAVFKFSSNLGEAYQNFASRLLTGFLNYEEIQDRKTITFKLTSNNYERNYFAEVTDREKSDKTMVEFITDATRIPRFDVSEVTYIYEFSLSKDELIEKLLSRQFNNLAANLKRVDFQTYIMPEQKLSVADVKSWLSFYATLNDLDEYGKALQQQGAKQKGDTVCDIANFVRRSADDFQAGKISLPVFKLRLVGSLTEKSVHILGERRLNGVSWKVIVGNILLALTGIGLIAIGGQLIYSKVNTGQFLLFGSPAKTTSTEKAEKLSASIKSLGKSI